MKKYFLLCVVGFFMSGEAAGAWRPTGKGDVLCQAYHFECQPELGRLQLTREVMACDWDGDGQKPAPYAEEAKVLEEKYNIFYPKMYSGFHKEGQPFPSREHQCQIGENRFDVSMDLIPNWSHPTWICMRNLYFLRANVRLNGKKIVDDLAFSLPCEVGHHDPDGWEIEKMELSPLRKGVDGASVIIYAPRIGYKRVEKTSFYEHVNFDNPDNKIINNIFIHQKDINKSMFHGLPYRD